MPQVLFDNSQEADIITMAIIKNYGYSTASDKLALSLSWS